MGVAALIQSAQTQQVWIGNRHFCTQTILQGLSMRGASFIVREHARHPRLAESGAWSAYSKSVGPNSAHPKAT